MTRGSWEYTHRTPKGHAPFSASARQGVEWHGGTLSLAATSQRIDVFSILVKKDDGVVVNAEEDEAEEDDEESVGGVEEDVVVVVEVAVVVVEVADLVVRLLKAM